MSANPNSAHKIAESILSELEHFQAHFKPGGHARTAPAELALKTEPCVGYVTAVKTDGSEIELFICRNYAPSNYKPKRSSTDYASYLSPLGRIIAKKPGERHGFKVHDRLGFVLDTHEFQLLAKDEFRPKKVGPEWDAIDNQIAWVGSRMAARSLRKLLEGVTEKEPTRSIRYSVQLPDQAILDEAQDDVFRLPFNGYIVITGAPGTGKTTVLLKRLSQKTKKEFLTESELKGVSDAAFKDGRSWLLFTPNDLLKLYLKEAMAKELLPATDDHVKVYKTFKLEVLRDSGLIRVGQNGYFRPAAVTQPLLKRSSGPEQLSLNKAFSEYLERAYSSFFRNEVQNFNNEVRSNITKLGEVNQRVLVTALDIIAKIGDDPIEIRKAQARAADYRKLNDQLATVVKAVGEITEKLDSVRGVSPLSIHNYAGRWQRLAATVSTDGFDTALFPEIPLLVAALQKQIRNLTEALSLSRTLGVIPRAYQAFREENSTQNRFFLPESEKALRERHLSDQEQDVILLHTLDFARQIRGEVAADLTGVPDELRSVLTRFRLFITVDEATDFSPLELACMERFALPEGGMTISGDPMQRVTETGLRQWSDMADICHPYKSCELNVSYRQTERLFRIARDLYKHSTGIEPVFKSAYSSRPEDPPALSFKSSKEFPCEKWLIDRICEIFMLGNKHLPTTAILVPTSADVEPLKRLLSPLLHENGLELDASDSGQSFGDAARVRIFPVEHIKGLEFEAVFYAGLDRMAEIHKELIDKYVYVGLSRARSFLGVVFERQFPVRLKSIESHFEAGNWGKSGV